MQPLRLHGPCPLRPGQSHPSAHLDCNAFVFPARPMRSTKRQQQLSRRRAPPALSPPGNMGRRKWHVVRAGGATIYIHVSGALSTLCNQRNAEFIQTVYGTSAPKRMGRRIPARTSASKGALSARCSATRPVRCPPNGPGRRDPAPWTMHQSVPSANRA